MDNVLTIIKPGEETMKHEMIPLREYAETLDIIKTPDQYAEAGTYGILAKRLLKKCDEYWDEDIEKARSLHFSLTGKKKAWVTAIKTFLNRIDIKMLAYNNEEKRKIALAQAEALEKQRKIDEAAEEKAKKLIKNGQHEKAQAVMSNIPQIPVKAPAPAKIQGISTRVTWEAEVINLTAFINWAIKSPQRDSLLLPNYDTLDNMVKAFKEQAKADGVKFFKKETIVRR